MLKLANYACPGREGAVKATGKATGINELDSLPTARSGITTDRVRGLRWRRWRVSNRGRTVRHRRHLIRPLLWGLLLVAVCVGVRLAFARIAALTEGTRTPRPWGVAKTQPTGGGPQASAANRAIWVAEVKLPRPCIPVNGPNVFWEIERLRYPCR